MSEEVVYIVQAVVGGPVKIGTTKSDRVRQRVKELQTGNPEPLRVVRLFRGGKGLEARLHSLFDFQRLSNRSEWFIVNQALQQLIDDGLEFAENGSTIQVAATYPDLVWSCDRCGQDIRKTDGFLGVHEEEAWNYEWAIADTRAEASGWTVTTGTDLFAGPQPARWVCLHDECLEPNESYSYWISVDRVTSFPRLLDFTAHIHRRPAMTCSDWFEFLRFKIGNAWDVS